MWRSLVWKEWHEQRWKLGFGLFLLLSLNFIGLRTRIVEDVAIAGFSYILGAIGLPMISALSLFAPERTEGSLATLLSLPSPPWRVMLTKLAVATVVVAVPILLAGVLAVLLAGGRESASVTLFTYFAMAAYTSVAMLIWMCAFSMRQPTEARAGLCCIGVFVAWLVTLGLIAPLQERIVMASPFAPLVFVGEFEVTLGDVSATILTQGVVLTVLIYLSIRRLAKPERSRA